MLLSRIRKNVPWSVALVSLAIAIGKENTCNAYASAKRVDDVDQRLEHLEQRLIEVDRNVQRVLGLLEK